MIGVAAMAAAKQGGTPEHPTGEASDKFDTEVFFHSRGTYNGKEMSLLEMKAYQQAWAVKRVQRLWRRAWDECILPSQLQSQRNDRHEADAITQRLQRMPLRGGLHRRACVRQPADDQHLQFPSLESEGGAQGKPCRAARLFAEGVREGGKYAMPTLHELRKIDQPCALAELIGLMDIPNKRGLSRDHRIVIWDEVRKRVGDPPPLPYDPERAAGGANRTTIGVDRLVQEKVRGPATTATSPPQSR